MKPCKLYAISTQEVWKHYVADYQVHGAELKWKSYKGSETACLAKKNLPEDSETALFCFDSYWKVSKLEI